VLQEFRYVKINDEKVRLINCQNSYLYGDVSNACRFWIRLILDTFLFLPLKMSYFVNTLSFELKLFKIHLFLRRIDSGEAKISLKFSFIEYYLDLRN
jgi:hypothetical protein